MTYKVIITPHPDGYKQTLYVRQFYFLWAEVSHRVEPWPYTVTVQEWQLKYNIPNSMVKLPFVKR